MPVLLHFLMPVHNLPAINNALAANSKLIQKFPINRGENKLLCGLGIAAVGIGVAYASTKILKYQKAYKCESDEDKLLDEFDNTHEKIDDYESMHNESFKVCMLELRLNNEPLESVEDECFLDEINTIKSEIRTLSDEIDVKIEDLLNS